MFQQSLAFFAPEFDGEGPRFTRSGLEVALCRPRRPELVGLDPIVVFHVEVFFIVVLVVVVPRNIEVTRTSCFFLNN